MSKTTFVDGTIVTAAFLNAVNNHRHTGRAIDGDGALDYAAATGSGNNYEVTLTPALDAYITGMQIIFKANFANTGPATLAINGMAAKDLKRNGGAALGSGDITIGMMVIAVYDGAEFQITNLPASQDTQIPVGSELLWPTETPPDGWLEENGAAISRTDYAALFAVIGVMYGAGDGITTFNLPDARGQFLRAWDHGRGLDPDKGTRLNRGDGTTGDHVGTTQSDQNKSHVHAETQHVHAPSSGGSFHCTSGGSGSYQMAGGGSGGPVEYTGNNAASNTASSGGNEARPTNSYRMVIIKY